jgi:alpha-L-arabinofuranosidase
MKNRKMLILAFLVLLILTSAASAGETLYNGIELPDDMSTVASIITTLAWAQQVPLVVDLSEKGPALNSTQYGIFYEEINHGGDGGLYAELTKNRSFEDSLDKIPNWSFHKSGNADGAMALVNEGMLNKAQARALSVELKAAGTVAVRNTGYWGINIQKDREYMLVFYAKSGLGEDAVIRAKLISEDGVSTFGHYSFTGLKKEWTKYATKFKATGTDVKGKFELKITSTRPGAVIFDFVSLFPPTWRNRPNGLRPDIAEMIQAMNPSIIRMPGGSYTSTYPDLAPEWLKEIGPIEERESHPEAGKQCHWKYTCTGGFGFHEYLLFAEDLGAEPIYVFQGGADPLAQEREGKTFLSGKELDQLIEKILDGIEYANGSVSTEWGAKRAAYGHPKPFNMRYIQIGNENWQKPFHDNYIKIYDAVKKKYPDMKIIWGGDWIGNNQHGYKSNGLMPEGSSADIVDEHFYKKDNWFYENTERYSPKNYPRGHKQAAKVFIGEASAWKDTLGAALKEAAFLLGAEKYSDKVVMAVYAPLLCNVNHKRWSANIINFDNYRVYGTPSYYVQLMLANNVGSTNVRFYGLDGLLRKTIFVNTTIETRAGQSEILIKLVNRAAMQVEVPIKIKGWAGPSQEFDAVEIVLTGKSQKAMNTFDKPKNVAPVRRELDKVGAEFVYNSKPSSFTILRLTAK